MQSSLRKRGQMPRNIKFNTFVVVFSPVDLVWDKPPGQKSRFGPLNKFEECEMNYSPLVGN